MTHKIDLIDIEDTHALTCPSCGKPVLLVHPNHSEVPGRRYWLTDGDTIPGLLGRLSKEQLSPDGVDCQLIVGACPDCDAKYYVVQAGFMAADSDDACEYLHFNADLGAEHNCLCHSSGSAVGLPAQWLLQEYSTPLGLMQSHIFGPYLLRDPGKVSGVCGVLARSADAEDQKDSPWTDARNRLLSLWDALRALHPELHCHDDQSN